MTGGFANQDGVPKGERALQAIAFRRVLQPVFVFTSENVSRYLADAHVK